MDRDYRVAALKREKIRLDRNEWRRLFHRVFDLQMELIAAKCEILDEEQSELKRLVRLSLMSQVDACDFNSDWVLNGSHAC